MGMLVPPPRQSAVLTYHGLVPHSVLTQSLAWGMFGIDLFCGHVG